MSPGRQTLARGRTATYTISTAALRPTAAGSSLALSLVPPLPAGITASIVPGTVAPGQVATLTLVAAGDAALGEVPFAVQAAEGAIVQTGSGTAVVMAKDFAAALCR